MSTKCSIGYGDDFHLYEECFDQDKIYIELNGDQHDLEVEFLGKNKSFTVAIDITTWRKIVESWNKSHWSSHPERDHEQPKIDLEYLQELAETIKKQKQENRNE